MLDGLASPEAPAPLFNLESDDLVVRTLSEVRPILPHPHPAVMFREVSEGAVLLQMEDEIYFGLNEVGTKVWQLLPPECTTFDDLCRRLAAAYPDVSSEQIRADVTELLDQLRGQKLLVDPSETPAS